jgi:type III secretory pathway lipoprotein EscJ
MLGEDTTLRSLVVKTQTDKKANQVVAYLKKVGIEARAADGATFGVHNVTEQPGWGVYVEPDKVKDAARYLEPVSKGLTFDPYTHASERD